MGYWLESQRILWHLFTQLGCYVLLVMWILDELELGQVNQRRNY